QENGSVLHVGRCVSGCLPSQQLVDNMEGHVDSCRYSCRGDDSFVHKPLLNHVDCRIEAPEGIESTPVSRCPFTMQESGFRQQQSAGANRGHFCCTRSRTPYPPNRFFILEQLSSSPPSGHDK